MRIEWIEKYMADAEQLIYENQLTEALAIMDNLLYEEPGYGSLHNHLGWAYLYYAADIEKAALHFKMAIQFDGAFAPPYLHMGNLCIRTGRYDEAIQYLEKGLKAQSPNKMALMECMAHAYELKQDYVKAITAYKGALASTVGAESEKFVAGIKRCRKKRWVMMFSF